MAKVLAGIAIAVVVVGAVTQLVLPGFVERHIERTLEEDSVDGATVVDLRAFPAVRLLWGSGDKFEARGRGLSVDLADRIDDPLGKLDGYDEVDIDFQDMLAGPVEMQAFSLVKREGQDDYDLRIEAETTPIAVAESVGGELGGELGRLIAGAATSTLPDGGQTDLPIDIAGQLRRTDDGGVDAEGVDASVAGVPAGPFTEAVVEAVLNRI